MEARQYELLVCLLGSPGADNPRDDALIEWLRSLLHKNRGATRDVPPPGLSGDRAARHQPCSAALGPASRHRGAGGRGAGPWQGQLRCV